MRGPRHVDVDDRIHRPFLVSLGSGGLASLKYLHLSGIPKWGGAGDQAIITPGSLPALRTLKLVCWENDGIVCALLGAAGPRLTSLEAHNGSVSTAVIEAMAERDLPWMSGLDYLLLTWHFSDEVEPSWAHTRPQIFSVLTRVPSLTGLYLWSNKNMEELIVRLLTLLESGGLPNMTLVETEAFGINDQLRGAALLLLLWAKRQAIKALEGMEEGHIPGARMDVYFSVYCKRANCFSTWIAQCMEQLEEAHTRM